MLLVAIVMVFSFLLIMVPFTAFGISNSMIYNCMQRKSTETSDLAKTGRKIICDSEQVKKAIEKEHDKSNAQFKNYVQRQQFLNSYPQSSFSYSECVKHAKSYEETQPRMAHLMKEECKYDAGAFREPSRNFAFLSGSKQSSQQSPSGVNPSYKQTDAVNQDTVAKLNQHMQQYAAKTKAQYSKSK